MNVKCIDTEKYLYSNDRIAMKSGQAMMADIKNMIMYPMTNPYNNNLPPMRTLLQVYNPPNGMNSELQQTISAQYESQLDENLKYSSFYGKNTKIDSHSSSSSTVAGNPSVSQNQGVIPSNHNPVYKENIGNGFLTRENFGGISIRKSFDSNTNSEQAIKVTKQQFTYPSRFDKQYTVTVPKSPTVQPLIVHVPINIPAIDSSFNGVSEKRANDLKSSSQIHSSSFNGTVTSSHISNAPKPIPLIVLLLQPPFETPHNHKQFSTHGNVVNYSTLDSTLSASNNSYPSISDTKNILNHSTKNHKSRMDQSSNILYNSYKSNTSENMKKMSNNASRFTTNVASQTNFYITNNLDRKTIRPTIKGNTNSFPSEFGNNIPSRLTSSKIQISNPFKDTNISSMMSSLINSSQIIESGDRTADSNNGLVPLFSAHIIPAGDVNKQKVLKICIPKDMLSFLLHLHNSTKSALEMTYQNLPYIQGTTNKTIHFQGAPFIKQFMEKMFMKSNFSDLQIPISTANEIYEAKKISSENFQNKQFILNRSFGQSQNHNEAHRQENNVQDSTSINNQNFDAKDNFLGISEKTSTNYHLLHEKKNTEINQNSFHDTERNSFTGVIPVNNYNSSNSFSQENSNGESGGSFYSVSHPIYQYVKIPNQITENRKVYKFENETREQNGNLNYSVNNYKSTSEHVLSTVQTTIQNSDFAESKKFQHTNSSFSKIHSADISKGNNYNNDVYKNTKNTQKFSTNIGAPASTGSYLERKINYTSYQHTNNFPSETTSQERIMNDHNLIQNNEQSHYQASVNENQAIERDSTLYTNQDLSKSDNQMTDYSQYNIPSKANENYPQINSQQYVEKQTTYTPTFVTQQSYTNQQGYPSSQYQTNNNRYISNSNFKSVEQQHAGDYTTVEVVPAFGFAIDSVNERQDYYNALSKSLRDVEKKYQAPYVHQKMYTTINENAYGPSVDDSYQSAAYDVNNRGDRSNNQYVQYQNQPNYNGAHYESQNRLIHGQIIMHPQAQSNHRSSLPLEDLGYSQDKPNVPFTY